ncbi:MAG: transposase [Mycobacteriaceae bacterium]
MPAQRKYPEELRERAVKMVFEVRGQDGKGRGEITRVARQLGIHPEALRSWVRQEEKPVPVLSGGTPTFRRLTPAGQSPANGSWARASRDVCLCSAAQRGRGWRWGSASERAARRSSWRTRIWSSRVAKCEE